MAVGILPYRPVGTHAADVWDVEYRRGDLDYFESLPELGRYSLLVGYVRFFGPARSLLDVGCGEGVLLDRLAASDFERYVGTDVAPAAIARARAREIPNRVSFHLGHLPPAELGRFQFIVCNEVLYCLDRPREMLARLSQLLEPGGYLLASIWHHRGQAALYRELERAFDLVDSVEVEALAETHTIRTRVSCWSHGQRKACS